MPGTNAVGAPLAGLFTNTTATTSHGTGFAVFHKNATTASALPTNPVPYFGSNGSYDTNVVLVSVPKVGTKLELYLLTPGGSAPSGNTVLNVFGMTTFGAADPNNNPYSNPGSISSSNFNSTLEIPFPLVSAADDSTTAITIPNTVSITQALTTVPANVVNWLGLSVAAADATKTFLLSKKQTVNLAGATSVITLVSTGSGIANSMIIGRFVS